MRLDRGTKRKRDRRARKQPRYRRGGEGNLYRWFLDQAVSGRNIAQVEFHRVSISICFMNY